MMKNIMKVFFYYLHIIFSIFVISLAFWPIKLLKKGLFLIPCLLTFLWLTYNKCPMNQLHHPEQEREKTKYHFFQKILSPVFPNITIKKCHQLATFLTSFIPTCILFRIFYLDK